MRPAWTSSRKVWPISGRLPGRDDLVCGEARGVAWLSGRLDTKRQALPLPSPPNRHGPRLVLTPNEHPALIFTPEANVLCWPGEEATSVLGAGRLRALGRAIRLSDRSSCLLPMPAAPGVPRPRLPRQPAHPAPPYRRSWSSYTSPQSYGRPSRRAKAAGLPRDFGLARLRREVAAAATARHGASMAHCVHRSWDPVPHRVRSPEGYAKLSLKK